MFMTALYSLAFTLGHPAIFPPEPPLSIFGWGPYAIGMTLDEVEAEGLDLPIEPAPYEDMRCSFTHPAETPEALHVMVVEDRITRFSLYGESEIMTTDGFKVGDPISDVKEVYRERAIVQPHEYGGPKAEYVTVWIKGGPAEGESVHDHDYPDTDRGYRFETDEDGLINAIHAGTPDILFIEGCS